MKRVFYLLAVTYLAGAGAAVAQTAGSYDNVGLDQLSSAVRGNSECLADLELAFPFSGIMSDLMAEEGARVTKRQPLAALDQEIEALEVDRRRAIWENQSELDAARIKADVSDQQFAAAERLAKAGGAISLEEVQNRRLARDLDRVDVERLSAQEKVEELDFRTAEAALAKRTLTSPSDGILAEVLRKPGESVQAYEPVIRLCDLSRIVFVANLPDAVAVGLAVGDPVTLRFAAAPDPVVGTLTLISPLVDAASGLRRVKIDLPQGLDWLRPGLGADLILP